MSPSRPSNVGSRTVDDPTALRALAHPLRLRLLDVVGREGEATAADAARQLDVSQALASHHLRQLAKYGFVEPADAPDGRARPWRLTSTSTHLSPTDPTGRAPADFVERLLVETAARQLAEWQERRPEEDPAWSTPTRVSNGILYLTVDELAELRQGWDALVRPYVDARPVGYADRRPDDAVPIGFTVVAVPLRPTEHGG